MFYVGLGGLLGSNNSNLKHPHIGIKSMGIVIGKIKSMGKEW